LTFECIVEQSLLYAKKPIWQINAFALRYRAGMTYWYIAFKFEDLWHRHVLLDRCEPTTDDVATAGVVEVSLYKCIARSLVSHCFSDEEKTRS